MRFAFAYTNSSIYCECLYYDYKSHKLRSRRLKLDKQYMYKIRASDHGKRGKKIAKPWGTLPSPVYSCISTRRDPSPNHAKVKCTGGRRRRGGCCKCRVQTPTPRCSWKKKSHITDRPRHFRRRPFPLYCTSENSPPFSFLYFSPASTRVLDTSCRGGAVQ